MELCKINNPYNTRLFLFVLFLFIYISLGLFNTYYNSDVTDCQWDLIYSIDSGVKFGWLYMNEEVYNIFRHPLMLFLLKPVINIFYLFTKDPKLTAVILQSLAGCIQVCLVHNIMMKLTKNTNTSLLFSLIFGFSYTVLLFTIFPEIYIWAGLSQMLFLNYFVSIYLSEKLNNTNIFILSVLTVICCGINFINITVFIPVIFLLAKIYKNNLKDMLKKFCQITIITLIIFFSLFSIQSYSQNFDIGADVLKTVNFQNIKGKMPITLRGTFVEPFYALKSEKSTKVITLPYRNEQTKDNQRWIILGKQNPLIYIPIFIFLFLPIFMYAKKYNSYKHKNLINSLLFVILLYSFFNYSFWFYECSVFALNYFPFLIILLGILYEKVKPNTAILLSFLIFQAVTNLYNIFKIHSFLTSISKDSHSYYFCSAWALCIVIIITLIVLFIMKFIKFIMSKYRGLYD